MSIPYVGEIRLFGGNFAPQDWLLCQGQLLPIALYETLFQLIGTTYGGDGVDTFRLPDLRGRVPVHMGTGPGLSQRVIGQTGGAEAVTLSAVHLPVHTHTLHASTAAASLAAPGGALLAATTVASYDTHAATTPMAAAAVTASGGNQPHDNMAPTLAVNYIIAIAGIFPSQG